MISVAKKPSTSKNSAIKKGQGQRRSKKSVPDYKFRQQLFVKAFIANGLKDQAAAAITAGFSIRSAPQIASRLLTTPWIHEAIEEHKAKIFKKYEVTADHVIGELARLGFSNMGDYIRTTADGGAVVDLSNLTEDQTAAIKKIETEVYVDGYEEDADGERQPIHVKRTKLELADKKAPLELLGKHVGVFQDTGAGNPNRQIRIKVLYEDGAKQVGVGVEVSE